MNPLNELKHALQSLADRNPLWRRYVAPALQAIERERAGDTAHARQQRALEALRRSDGITISELSEEIGVGYSAARRYLQEWQRRGVVGVRSLRTHKERSRPRRLFYPKEK